MFKFKKKGGVDKRCRGYKYLSFLKNEFNKCTGLSIYNK